MTESPRQTAEPLLPGEAGPRITAAVARRLIAELPLAIRAAQQVRRRPGLVLAVVFLATIAFHSSVLNEQARLRGYPGYDARSSYAMAVEAQAESNFFERWLDRYRLRPGEPLLFRPLHAFTIPLASADSVADGWIRLAARPLFPLHARMNADWALRSVAISIPMVLIRALILVALIGSIKDGSTSVTSADVRRYWKEHYWPVLPILLIGMGIWYGFEAMILHWWERIVEIPNMDTLAELTLLAPAVTLMLAPFVVVGRGVGWTTGIIEGLRLLRRRWFALVTLFVLYRVGYELIPMWNALSPWPARRAFLNLSIPAPVLWVWVGEIGIAVLGLWVAYAFVEIARGLAPVPAEQ